MEVGIALSLFKSSYSPIVGSSVPDAIRLTLLQAEEQTYKLQCERRNFCLDYYNNNILEEDGGKDEYLKNFFGRQVNSTWEYIDKLFLEHVPLTEQLIDLKARNYRQQPTRKIGMKDAKAYEDLNKRSHFASTAKRIEQYTQLLHDIAVGVFLDEETKTLRDLIITEYIPFFADDDQFMTDPIAIAYPTAQQGKNGQQQYAYYDDKVFMIVERDGTVVKQEPNTYGVFNFYFPHRKKPIRTHFSDPRVSLVQANQAIDVSVTALNQLLHYNGWKMPYILGEINEGELQNLALGKTRVLQVKGAKVDETQPAVGVLDMGVDFTKHVEAIKFKFEEAAQCLNVDYQWKAEGGPQPGITLIIQKFKDFEDRETQVEIIDEYLEQPRYRIVKAISKNFKLKVEEGELTVDFPEPEIVLDTTNEVASQKHKLETNQINVVDLIMKQNPDLSKEDAVKVYKANVNFNALGQKAGATEEKDLLAILDGEEIDGITISQDAPNQPPEASTGGSGKDKGAGQDDV